MSLLGRFFFYNAHIKSHIDYASTIWDGAGEVHLKKLSSFHRRAAKLIRPDPLLTDQKLSSLNMLPLHKHLLYNKGTFMYKLYSNCLPNYLLQLLPKLKKPKYVSLRCMVSVPKPRIDMYKTSLSYTGGALWNSLPSEIQNSPSLAIFKTRFNKHLILDDLR